VSDFVVLIANRQGAVAPDVDHNHGHNRYETVASLFLGGLLIAVDAGMLWRTVEKNGESSGYSAPPFVSAYCGAHRTCLEEAPFRYMLHAAKRVRRRCSSPKRVMRVPTPSSFIVALGIIGKWRSAEWAGGSAGTLCGICRTTHSTRLSPMIYVQSCEYVRRARSARIADAENGRSGDR
jgi:divalent metal cation (Fe/Co/Zn/Cd) transporter